MTNLTEQSGAPPARFCTRCRERVPDKSAAHGGTFCSPECRYQDKTARRRWRASKRCPTCNRAHRHPKASAHPVRESASAFPDVAQTEYLAAQAGIGGLHG